MSETRRFLNAQKEICFICGYEITANCFGTCHLWLSRQLHEAKYGWPHHEYVPGAIVGKEWLEMVKQHLKVYEI